MLVHALVALSLEVPHPNPLRSAAAAVASAAIKFMRASAKNEGSRVPHDETAENEHAPVDDQVHESVVVLMRLPQLISLFEELLVMFSREQRAGWQRAVVAAAQNLCRYIESSHDAVVVLLLLLYHSPSLDSVALIDACFPRLLSKCPQVRRHVHRLHDRLQSLEYFLAIDIPCFWCRSAANSSPLAWWSTAAAPPPSSCAFSTPRNRNRA